MSNVGENLRHEREIRGMTLEQVAEATGVSVVYLGAMERGEFEALPGRAFGKLYIRAYAEVLDFDPRPLIEEYDREHRPERVEAFEHARSAPVGSRPVAEAIARWKAGRTGGGDEPVIEARTEEAPPEESAPEASPPEEASLEEAPPEEIVAPPPETPTVVEVPAIEPEPLAVDEPAPGDTQANARTLSWRTALALAVCVVIAGAIYLAVRPAGSPESTTAVPVEPSEPHRVPITLPPPDAPPASTLTPSPRPAAPPAVAAPAPPGALTVPEFGIGRRIVDRQLEGEGDRFAEGDVVVFQTRVLGGRRGQRVRHVWIFDGRAQQSIELRLGGADWRTHTSKTLYRSGTWTVEARDDGGRVLATATFACVPRSR